MPQTLVDHRYRIISKLGEGGMGAVYLALDERLEREVALKRLHVIGVAESQREQFIHRFQREAKSMARFSHPNIVHVYDYGQDEAGVYLVLEYMPNGTLKQHLGKINDPAEAARLLLPVAEALHYIHQRGMVHRDVKPANILFDEMNTPKLADFGIVKLLDQEGMTLTATGVGIGTPDYMAPEQVGKDFDHHVDQYALGVILYELVTGKKPYQGDTPIQTLLMHVTEPLPDPRTLVPDLADSACAVIRTALGKKPADRFADTGAFIAGLRMMIRDMGESTHPISAPVQEGSSQPVSTGAIREELPFDLPPAMMSASETFLEGETQLAGESSQASREPEVIPEQTELAGDGWEESIEPADMIKIAEPAAGMASEETELPSAEADSIQPEDRTEIGEPAPAWSAEIQPPVTGDEDATQLEQEEDQTEIGEPALEWSAEMQSPVAGDEDATQLEQEADRTEIGEPALEWSAEMQSPAAGDEDATQLEQEEDRTEIGEPAPAWSAEMQSPAAGDDDATRIAGEDQTEIADLSGVPLEEATRLAEEPVLQAAPTAAPKKKFPWLWAGIGTAGLAALILLGIFLLPGLINPSSHTPKNTLTAMEINLTRVAELNQQGNDAANPTQAKPTESPHTDRRGGWLDEIVINYTNWDDVIPRMTSGELQIASVEYDQPWLFGEIESSGLQPLTYSDLTYDLTLNPTGNPTFPGNGVFNPFSSPELRRAVNYLLDREYIVNEIFGNMAQARWLPIWGNTRDAEQFPEVHQAAEEYGFDPGKAQEIIHVEMEAMGAEFTDEGWFYQGQPVVLNFIIREDGNGMRKFLGDFIAGQFQQIGFQVERQYMGSEDAYAVWFQGNPKDGAWHMYTGAWHNEGWVYDSGPDFQFFSSAASEYAQYSPLWQAYTQNDPDYDMAVNLLAEKGYNSVGQRDDLMRQVINQYFEAPYRIFLVEGSTILAANPDVRVAVEKAGNGVFDLSLWPYTLRYADREGGSMTLGMPMIFCDLINAFEADCESDRQWLHAINDGGMMFNPKTQVPALQRVHTAAVTAAQDVPIREDESGVKLNFTDVVEVPGDAWVDWDVDAKQFIPASQAYPDGRTVAVKSVVTYSSDLYETVFWHDGSPFSAADIVFHLIFQFERTNERSESYDPDALSPHDNGMVAWRITNTKPLVIEVYRDSWELDAANNVVDLWPNYGVSEAPWQLVTVSNWADLQGFSATTRARQEFVGIDMPMSWFNPECTGMLRELLEQEYQSAYIPYVATLSDYITEDEARMRYENLMNFYDEFGHFFVGTGPYQVTSFEMYSHIVLSHNPRYPDPADQWDQVMP